MSLFLIKKKLDSVSTLFEETPLYVLIISIGALFLPFIYLDSLVDKSVLPKYAFVTVISFSAFIFWLKDSYRKTHFFFNKLFYLLLTIYLYSACSPLWSEYSGTYTFEIINLSCFILLCFTCIQIRNHNNIQLILSSAILGGTITVIIVFVQIWGWNPFSYVINGTPAASFINKNHLANYVDLLIPICFSLLVISEKTVSKWFYAFSLSFLFSFIIVSHTRGSWISLLVILLLLLFLLKRHPQYRDEFTKTPKFIIVFLVLFTGILSQSSPGSINETSRFSALLSSSSASSHSAGSATALRLQAYKAALKMIKANPITGVGLGNFNIAYIPYRYQSEPNRPKQLFLQLHNDPLQIIVELGILGGVIWFSFIFLVFYLPLKKLTYYCQNNVKSSILYLGILFSLLASGIHSLFSFPLHQPATSFLILVLIGLILNVFSIQQKKTKFNTNSLYFIAAIITLSAAKFYTSYISSSLYLNTAIKSIYLMSKENTPIKLKQIPPLKSDCIIAKKHTDKSLELFQTDYNYHTWIFVIYTECVKNNIDKLKFTDKVLKNNPYHYNVLEMAGLTYFKEKKYDSAKTYISRLHSLYPLNNVYTLWLGHIAVRQKNFKLASMHYKNTLKLEPENQVAKDMLKKIILINGKT